MHSTAKINNKTVYKRISLTLLTLIFTPWNTSILQIFSRITWRLSQHPKRNREQRI